MSGNLGNKTYFFDLHIYVNSSFSWLPKIFILIHQYYLWVGLGDIGGLWTP